MSTKNILHSSVLSIFFLTHHCVIRYNSGTFIQLSQGEGLITTQSYTEFAATAIALQMKDIVKKEFRIKRQSLPFDCGRVGLSAATGIRICPDR